MQKKVTKKNSYGQTLVELLLVMGLAGIILPALIIGIVASREGKVQQEQKTTAVNLLFQAEEAIRNAREAGWDSFAIDGTYHPDVNPDFSWGLSPGPASNSGGFTTTVEMSSVYRDSNGAIASSGGTLDPSTKHLQTTISWPQPFPNSITSSRYFTRYLDNLTWIQTTLAHFDAGTLTQVKTTNTSGGEVQLDDNNKAKWCSPDFANSTIDLPDGPPVAVAATASATISSPNDVFVATAPFATSSVKLAYVNVSANEDPPASTLRGTFTLDATKYSDVSYVPTGINLDNNFKTNDVKYYTSPAGKQYALIATNLPTKEVIAVQVNDGSGDAFQDPVNKIYKYHTFFNTRIFNTSAGLDTGFANPSAEAEVTSSAGDNDGFQSFASRAYSDNSSFAIDTNSGNGTSTSCVSTNKDKHRYYNYGFSLPTGATINGIEVRLDARVDSQVGSPQMCVQLSWDGGTTWTTTQSTTTLTTGEATYTLGGSGDTWGRTWSNTDFTNSNFRVRVINVASDTTRDFSLDWIPVRVHYSLPPSATNDQAPFDYGGTTLTVLGDKGYVASGGYLYVIDLSSIDSKSPSTELDQLGCRIELDGFDCQVGSQTLRKYSTGETGTSWSSTASQPSPYSCSDGGNIELNATNDIYGVQVDGSTYVYVAVGARIDAELNIINATNIPSTSSSPTINNSTCGRITGGNSGWKRVGTYDFNSDTGTEEAANSVFAKSDGTRAYISSNGGIDGNGDGESDSKQFYIINTSNPSSPSFLSGSPSTGPSSGFYQGSGANGETYPRRSLTVLNGQRVVLVGKDGVANGNDAEEYQVLDSSNEATPTYCDGIDFDEGFNDLTSVTESDLDNFVYMVANNTLNELKIIQGGPDGAYLDNGTLESSTFDVGYNTAFNNFTANTTRPANTDVKYQIAGSQAVNGSCSGVGFTFLGPDGTSNTYYDATGSAILIGTYGAYTNPGRCFRYKAFLSTTDFNATPIFQDATFNYSP